MSIMMVFSPEDLVKLLLAVAVGAVIGFERELHSKAAGLRTITLITVGATMFTLISLKLVEESRIAANIVTGVGFLGAGTILFSEGKVKGLTTASSVWASASLGMAIGVGEYVLAGVATLVILAVLGIFARLDRWLDFRGRETRAYQITYLAREAKHQELEALFSEHKMRVRSRKRLKEDNYLIGLWELEGKVAKHTSLSEKLLADQEISELHY
ncbi:MAG: MgtC/SapB family protein [Chloroflexota bacterium]